MKKIYKIALAAALFHTAAQMGMNEERSLRWAREQYIARQQKENTKRIMHYLTYRVICRVLEAEYFLGLVFAKRLMFEGRLILKASSVPRVITQGQEQLIQKLELQQRMKLEKHAIKMRMQEKSSDQDTKYRQEQLDGDRMMQQERFKINKHEKNQHKTRQQGACKHRDRRAIVWGE